MLENNFFRRLIYANTFLWICVTFTVATFLDLTLTTVFYGDTGTTSYQHLGTRFIICTLASVSLLVFRLFKKLPFPVIMGMHFLACLGFAVLYIWITGIFMEQHPGAMFYMVRSVLIIYPFIAACCIAIDFALKKWGSGKTS